MSIFPSWRSKCRGMKGAGPSGPAGASVSTVNKKAATKAGRGQCKSVQEDTIEVALPLLSIKLTRRLSTDVPHEVSVIVPRAEMRFGEQEIELVYSSITIVHAPRHPLAGEQPPGGHAGPGTPGATSAPTAPVSPAAAEGSKPPAVRITFRT